MKRNAMKKILYLFLFSFLLACQNSNENQGGINESLLPNATGGYDEIMFFVSDAIYSDTLSKQMKKAFVQAYKILPQPEARFVTSTVAYSKRNNILKRFINSVFVLTQDEKSAMVSEMLSILTAEEKKALQNGSQKVFYKKNLWAKGQNIMLLIAPSVEEIPQFIEQNEDEINEYFDETNLSFYQKIAYIDGVNLSLNKQFKAYHNFTLDVPNGYKIAKNEGNMILLRRDESKSTLFLCIDVVNYNDTIADYNYGIEKFDEIGKHLDGMKENSYAIADTTLGFAIEKSEVEGRIIYENGGLWVMENDIVGGGPFINQLIIDNANQRMIYLAGIVYGPGEKNKKKYMRQFEAIFNTLKINTAK